MISVIYAKVGSDSFTQIIQHEYDDVKIPIEKPIYKDVEKEVINEETGETEKVKTQEFVKNEIIYKTPEWWSEPKEVSIPSGCVTMSEIRPDTNYIAEDNGDGTGKWVINDKYYVATNQSIIDKLTSEASQKIATLQDAIDLDMAEDGDADKLKKWRKYRVLLSRVDTSVENMKLPEKPN